MPHYKLLFAIIVCLVLSACGAPQSLPPPTAAPATSLPTPQLSSASRIAFFTQSAPDAPLQFVLRNIDGSQSRPSPTFPIRPAIAQYTLDGNRVGFTTLYIKHGVGVFSVVTMHLDGSAQTRLTDDQFYALGLAWSPDGTQLAVTGHITGPTAQRERGDGIFIYRADGARVRRLTPVGIAADGPAWSSDGRTLAYVQQKGADIVLVLAAVDGTSAPRMTTITNVFHPSWSPDGTRLVYARGVHGHRVIVTTRLDGSEQQELTAAGDDVDDPVWSPDGQWIAYTLYQDHHGRGDIMIMHPDGSQKTHVTQDGHNWQPQWVSGSAISPTS
jgi:Tol biopolymer transport system component